MKNLGKALLDPQRLLFLQMRVIVGAQCIASLQL